MKVKTKELIEEAKYKTVEIEIELPAYFKADWEVDRGEVATFIRINSDFSKVVARMAL